MAEDNMDSMDDMFDVILFTQSDMEIANISELLSNNPDIFDEDIDVDETDLQLGDIAEVMHITAEIFDLNVFNLFKKKVKHFFCLNWNNNTYTTNKLTSFIKYFIK